MLSLGSAGGIEKGVLDEEDERRAGVAGFPMGDLVEGAAEVNGAGASACGGAPGDGAVQRPVHFECAGAVAIAAERGAKRRRETVAGRSEEHTSELQSLRHLVCRLLLEKKKEWHRHPHHARRGVRPTALSCRPARV